MIFEWLWMNWVKIILSSKVNELNFNLRPSFKDHNTFYKSKYTFFCVVFVNKKKRVFYTELIVKFCWLKFEEEIVLNLVIIQV